MSGDVAAFAMAQEEALKLACKLGRGKTPFVLCCEDSKNP